MTEADGVKERNIGENTWMVLRMHMSGTDGEGKSMSSRLVSSA